MRFSITIEIDAESINEADDIACAMSEDVEGMVANVRVAGRPADDSVEWLNGREHGTVIDCLAIVRDQMIEKGLTGNDCQSALSKICRMTLPQTAGIRIEPVNPS